MVHMLEDLPVMSMAAIILAVLLIAVALINFLIARLGTGERGKGFAAVSPGLLPPLGVIFGLLIGFVAAQVWGDFDRARVAVNKEAGALREITLIAPSFPGETEARLLTLVREHIEMAIAEEWPLMASQHATVIKTSAPLAQALRLTFAIDAQDVGHASAERALARRSRRRWRRGASA